MGMLEEEELVELGHLVLLPQEVHHAREAADVNLNKRSSYKAYYEDIFPLGTCVGNCLSFGGHPHESFSLWRESDYGWRRSRSFGILQYLDTAKGSGRLIRR